MRQQNKKKRKKKRKTEEENIPRRKFFSSASPSVSDGKQELPPRLFNHRSFLRLSVCSVFLSLALCQVFPTSREEGVTFHSLLADPLLTTSCSTPPRFLFLFLRGFSSKRGSSSSCQYLYVTAIVYRIISRKILKRKTRGYNGPRTE